MKDMLIFPKSLGIWRNGRRYGLKNFSNSITEPFFRNKESDFFQNQENLFKLIKKFEEFYYPEPKIFLLSI